MGSKNSKSAPQLRLKLSVAQQMLKRDSFDSRFKAAELTSRFDDDGELASACSTPPDTLRNHPSHSHRAAAPSKAAPSPRVTHIQVTRHKGKIGLKALARKPRACVQTEETVSVSPRCYESFSTTGRTLGGSDISQSPRASFATPAKSTWNRDLEPDVESLFITRSPRKGKQATVTVRKSLTRKSRAVPALNTSRVLFSQSSGAGLIGLLQEAATTTPATDTRLMRKRGVRFISPTAATAHEDDSRLSVLHEFLRNRSVAGAGKSYVQRKAANDSTASRRLSDLLQLGSGAKQSRAEQRWQWTGAHGAAARK